jgi:thiopurine S-methyltransferase
MEKDFWIDKWNIGQIGFHQDKPNSFMEEYFKDIDLTDKRIFVPLCGKTLDMIWFKDKGAKVVGVELSELAIKSFFSENQIPYTTLEIEKGTLFQSDDISIYCCNFFDIPNEATENIDYIFDRASLIALPEEIRTKYVSKMKELMNTHIQYMIITIEYEGGGGPPFSITKEKIHNDFSDLKVSDISTAEREATFRGESRRTHSHVFLITK